MAMDFEFSMTDRLVFGAGKAAIAVPWFKARGVTKVALVTGSRADRAAQIAAQLDDAGIAFETFTVAGEPTTTWVDEAAGRLREASCGGVLAFGGGSAVDAGKALAALANNPGRALDYLEVVGAGKALTAVPLPFVAIPTTAGTGSEATKNAVLGVPHARAKASMRSPMMLPDLAIIDPDLLATVPRATVAAAGLDALSQLIEPFVSRNANPLCDAWAKEGIRRSARALAHAYEGGLEGPDKAGLREDLALASVLGGLCLANAGLGAVHGFAAPLGGMFDAPHGAICAALLSAVMDVNRKALCARQPQHPSLPRFDEIAVLLTGDPAAKAEQGLGYVEQLCARLKVPGLGAFGVSVADIPTLVTKGKAASSMKKNPIDLTDDELSEILMRSI